MPFYIGSFDGILQDVKISLVEQRGTLLQTPSSRKVEVAQCIAALTNLALFLVGKQSCA